MDQIAASSPQPDGLLYGNGCFAVGRYVEASEAFQKALFAEPDDPDARFNLGLSYLRLGRPQEAVSELNAVLEREPLLAEAYYQRGNAYDDLRQRDQAVLGLRPRSRNQARLPASGL